MSGETLKKCPVCGCLDFLKLNKGRLLHCFWCGVNLKFEQNCLVEFHEEVAESTEYQVYLPSIPRTYTTPGGGEGIPLPPLRARWPPYCTLCLKSVTSDEFYKISCSLYLPGLGYGVEYSYLVKVEIKIPYCKECRHKIKKWLSREKEAVGILPIVGEWTLRDTGVKGYEFRFRNPQYAKLFRQMNVVAPSELFKQDPSFFSEEPWRHRLYRTRRSLAQANSIIDRSNF